RINELASCLHKCLRNFISQSRTRLRFLSERTLAREVVQRLRDSQQQLDVTTELLQRRVRQFFTNATALLATEAQSLRIHHPKTELLIRRNRFTEVHRRLASQPPRLLQGAREHFWRIEGMLRVLGPDATLQRGYSMTTDLEGNIIQTTRVVRP